MSITMTVPPTVPWYRQPFVWLLILFPSLAVVGGIITIFLAVSSDDGLVVDDYYKHGKEINRTLERDNAAALYGIEAGIRLDPKTGALTVQLNEVVPEQGQTLVLRLLHPTVANRDVELTLEPLGQHLWTAQLEEVPQGPRYVHLETDKWRLTATASLPDDFPLALRAE